jgi:hypothetical protein
MIIANNSFFLNLWECLDEELVLVFCLVLLAGPLLLPAAAAGGAHVAAVPHTDNQEHHSQHLSNQSLHGSVIYEYSFVVSAFELEHQLQQVISAANYLLLFCYNLIKNM